MNNRYEMFAAMINQSAITIYDSRGIAHNGWILGISNEDGSGHSFNVKMYDANNLQKEYHIKG